MKTLNLTVNALAVYNTSIEVPDDLTLEQAIDYAKDHLSDVPLGDLEWVGDAGLDEDNCDFAEESEPDWTLTDPDTCQYVRKLSDSEILLRNAKSLLRTTAEKG